MRGFSICNMLISILLLSCFGNKKEFEYRDLSSLSVFSEKVKLDLEGFVYIEDFLPKNFVVDGSVDYTKNVQEILDRNLKVIFPDFPILVNDNGIMLKSNSILYFQEKSLLVLKASDKTNYSILNVSDVSNVKIFNPKIKGDRFVHIGVKGEWGMGIKIVGSSNIEVFNSQIYDCWGDGIYIGSSKYNCSKGIKIQGGFVDNNRRNGVSIVCGQDILVSNLIMANTNGTLPMAGIDIEPNNNNENIRNIILRDNISFNNAEVGFLTYLGSHLGGKEKLVTIDIINCKDYFSHRSLSIPGLRNDYSNDIKKIKGKINIINFVSEDSNKFFAESSGNYIYTPSIYITNTKIRTDNLHDEDKNKRFSQWVKSKKSIFIDNF